jgi:hypothetical protein
MGKLEKGSILPAPRASTGLGFNGIFHMDLLGIRLLSFDKYLCLNFGLLKGCPQALQYVVRSPSSLLGSGVSAAAEGGVVL